MTPLPSHPTLDGHGPYLIFFCYIFFAHLSREIYRSKLEKMSKKITNNWSLNWFYTQHDNPSVDAPGVQEDLTTPQNSKIETNEKKNYLSERRACGTLDTDANQLQKFESKQQGTVGFHTDQQPKVKCNWIEKNNYLVQEHNFSLFNTKMKTWFNIAIANGRHHAHTRPTHRSFLRYRGFLYIAVTDGAVAITNMIFRFPWITWKPEQ